MHKDLYHEGEWENMVDVHKVDIVLFLKKYGEFLPIVPQKFSPIYAGTEILETPITGTTCFM